jgi:hypothetical protein
MGTSSDYGGGRGGAWTPYKHAASNFTRRGGSGRAGKAVARYVSAVGGASSAARGSRSAVTGGQTLGAFVADLARANLSEALQRLDLGELVGKSRFEVLDGLLEAIAGPGSGLEEQAARSAACDVLDELFPPDANDYEELEEVTVDAGQIVEMLDRFLAAYIYRRMLPTIAEKLTHLEDHEAAQERAGELREYIRLRVALELEDRDPLEVDWRGAEGQQIIERVLNDAYEALETEE